MSENKQYNVSLSELFTLYEIDKGVLKAIIRKDSKKSKKKKKNLKLNLKPLSFTKKKNKKIMQ